MNCCFCYPYKICGAICNSFTINLKVPYTGIYSLVYEYGGMTKKIEQRILEGELLQFDTSCINPIYKYIFKVYYQGRNLIFEDQTGNMYDHFLVTAQGDGIDVITKPLNLL